MTENHSFATIEDSENSLKQFTKDWGNTFCFIDEMNGMH